MVVVRGVAGISRSGSKARLKPGWIKADVVEYCNWHWQRPAAYVYAGTPLCAPCVVAMGGAELDLPAADEAAPHAA